MLLPAIEIITPNFTRVKVGDLTTWFSFVTIVAFSHPDTGTVVRQNEWSVTTGKHLNAIDGGDKSRRVDGQNFKRELDKLTSTKD